jgi:hypothetical protein
MPLDTGGRIAQLASCHQKARDALKNVTLSAIFNFYKKGTQKRGGKKRKSKNCPILLRKIDISAHSTG